jgi:hypothetical protein
VDWDQADAALLWRYHLHYWDWAWCLATMPDRAAARAAFRALLLSWRSATTVGRGVAWSPYVVSLRAWSWCGLRAQLADGTTTDAVLARDLAGHRAFLRVHLETDVGGNHLVKNLKALIGLAVAAGDSADTQRWTRALRREVDRQVLADGGHAERAPAYHCQVLADLVDVVGLLAADGRRVPELTDAAGRMRGWLVAILGPTGTVPMLNDGFPVPSDAVEVLLADPSSSSSAPAAARTAGTATSTARPVPAPPSPVRPGTAEPARQDLDRLGHRTPPGRAEVPTADVRLLAASGLAVLRAGRWQLLADVGLPCPDDLPAHAHADSLGFLLWHDGVPLLVDTGTSTYAPGPRRDAERGSAAHSTVVVDGADSTEVWAAFRAGRRARPRLLRVGRDGDRVTLSAEHDGYRSLPGRPRHRRTWWLCPDGPRIVDQVLGAGEHTVEVYVQLPPGFRLRPGCELLAGTSPAGSAAAPGTATTPDAEAEAEADAGTGGLPGDRTETLEFEGVPGAGLALRARGPGRWRTVQTDRAVAWGRTVTAPTAVYRVRATLPVTVEVTMTLHPVGPAVGPADGPAPSTTAELAAAAGDGRRHADTRPSIETNT